MDIFRPTRSDKNSFRADEDGAVTVDWVVLTASVVFMGMAAAFYVAGGVPEVANNIGSYMEQVTVMPQ